MRHGQGPSALGSVIPGYRVLGLYVLGFRVQGLGLHKGTIPREWRIKSREQEAESDFFDQRYKDCM